jgi:hypothetical protein
VVSSVVVLVALFVGYLRFFAPFRELDLTVWVRQRIEIALPAAAGDGLPLRLLLGSDTVTRANLLDVEISNAGRRPIGAEDPPRWTLNLHDSKGARLQLIGRPQVSPANLTYDLETQPHSISLRVGLFNPGDRIVLRLLVIDPAPEGDMLSAETRITGLAAPTVTEQPLPDRVQSAFVLPLLVPIFVVLVGVFLWDSWKRGRLQKPNAFGDTVLGILVIALLGSAMSAYVLAWIAARVAVALAAR